MVLLYLVFTGFSGCDNKAQEQDPETPTARLKALSESMDADDITQIRELIKAGADVNVRNQYGATPLMMMSQKGHSEIVKLLLEAGADVNAADTDGCTSLWMASQNDHSEVVKLLLEAKADVNARSRQAAAGSQGRCQCY